MSFLLLFTFVLLASKPRRAVYWLQARHMRREDDVTHVASEEATVAE